jgi:hypothetical protein
MKIIKEHISEKFEEHSDPIADLRISKIYLNKIYKETVIDGMNR